MAFKSITPEQLANSGSEEAHQKALFCWAALNFETYPELRYMFHVPNGGFRNKSEAATLRAMGVKKGVPDIWLPIKRGQYSGLVTELKKPGKDGKAGGRTEPQQKEWIAFLKTQGYGAMVAIGWEQAREGIISYLEWK